MRVLTLRDMKRLEAACRKVERMAAINQVRRQPVPSGFSSGGGGDSIPTERLTLSPTSTWDTGTETKHVYLDRDIHRNKILYYNIRDPFWFHLPMSPVIGDTYTIAVHTIQPIFVRSLNFDHFIRAPLFSYQTFENQAIHGHWFCPYVGPQSICKYGYEWMTMYMEEFPELIQWLEITYTGIEVQVAEGYEDVDGDGMYWNSDWNDQGYGVHPNHPLILKTSTEWQVRRIHGNCVCRVEGAYGEDDFAWPWPF
jgi:hypothetical protein